MTFVYGEQFGSDGVCPLRNEYYFFFPSETKTRGGFLLLVLARAFVY